MKKGYPRGAYPKRQPNHIHGVRITELQARIFQMIGGGYSLKEIAVDRGVSQSTINAHIIRFKNYYGLKSNAQACLFLKSQSVINPILTAKK